MGSEVFFHQSKGKNAAEAFHNAYEEAVYDVGHQGYSGTIAEKETFILIKVPKGKDPVEYANKLINDSDERIDDKWGPAGCIKINKGEYLFFGWASC